MLSLKRLDENMDLPRIGKSDRGVFGDLKAKLGFEEDTDQQSYDDRYYEEEEDVFDDAPDYGEYGYDYAEQGYDDRYAASNVRPLRSNYGNAGYGAGVSAPNLITPDDVRAYNRMPENQRRESAPRDVSTNTQGAGADDASSSYGSAYGGSPLNGIRSNGLSSLFTPSSGAAPASAASAAGDSSAPAEDDGVSYRNSNNRVQWQNARLAAAAANRRLKIIKPLSYADAEGITAALKAGDAVVLGLGNTQEALSKRLLDFAFGAASALDAGVDCIGPKVFALTIGPKLSESECAELRRQGVIA